jgi:trk system potassium uptake protein TrkH
MRFQIVLRYIGFALLLNALFMLISCIISFFTSDNALLPLLYSFLVTAIFGIFPLVFVPKTAEITNKEGLLIVVASWFLSCLFGAIPYVLWSSNIFTFTDAWFESVSGFTTTGSSILINIEQLPMSLLFWRASTHWIGGIGIIIFVLSVLPNIGIVEVILFRSEISPMVADSFQQQSRKAIQILVRVYLVLTLLEIISLCLSGMNLFDAITHSFATIATGGFSTKNNSIAYYNSPLIEAVIMIFMILSGMNFVLLFSIFTGNVNEFWKSTVVKYYLVSLAIAILFTSYNMYMNLYHNWWDAFRFSSFNIISVGTSTGFANTDTSIWPSFSQLILIFFTLQCACSGSTSGGIKTDRVVILFKAILRNIKKIMHPNAVLPVKINKSTIQDDLVLKSVVFIGVYLIIIFIMTLLLTLLDIDILSAFSGTIACMGNVGPGLGEVGSMANYHQIPMIGKWILSITMLLGRLEIYAFFIFFTPSQWSKTVTY